MISELNAFLSDKVGDDLWEQYRQAGISKVLVYEIQEAVAQARAPDDALVQMLLEKGADANAFGHAEELSDLEDDEEDEDEDEESEEENGLDEDSEEHDDGTSIDSDVSFLS